MRTEWRKVNIERESYMRNGQKKKKGKRIKGRIEQGMKWEGRESGGETGERVGGGERKERENGERMER